VKRVLPIILLIFMASGVLSGIEWMAVDVDFALTWQYNAQIGTDPQGKQPSILMFNIGSSIYGDWDGERGGGYFRPGGWFSWNIEEVYLGIARPTDEATLSHMKVLGLMLDAPFGYVFNAGGIDVGVQGGPSFYLRLPLWTAQNGDADPADFWTAYYGAAQFLYLGIASWAAIPVNETMDFLAGLRFYYPVSNFWTDAPLAHGIQVALTASLRFELKKN
jgi:hypothetical protein